MVYSAIVFWNPCIRSVEKAVSQGDNESIGWILEQ